MTDEQRQKIKILRCQGIGHKKIADEVELSRDLVRGYCRRNGLDGCGTELAAEYHNVMQDKFLHILCLNCGSEIEQNSLGRKKILFYGLQKRMGKNSPEILYSYLRVLRKRI